MATNKQPPSFKASDAPLLPGDGWEVTTPPPVKVASSNGPPARWWVRTSPSQVVSPKSKLPLGFKHTLMNDHKVVCSGVGADAGRTLHTQAGFMNNLEAAGGLRSGLQRNAASRRQSCIHRAETTWLRAKRSAGPCHVVSARPQGGCEAAGEDMTAASSSRWLLRPDLALSHTPL